MTVIDASVWVSRLLTTEIHHAASRSWLSGHFAGNAPVDLPASALAEISSAIARRTGSRAAAKEAISEILDLPMLILTDVDSELAAQAADVASRLRVRGMDALYVALAFYRGLPLVTWDREQLDRARSVIDVRTPS